MKILKISYMQTLLLSMFISNGGNLLAQKEEWTKQKADKWFNNSEWSSGLKAKIHSSVNIQEFAEQYHKNRQAWDKAYLFLKNTDLEKLAPGKYPIESDTVFAVVSEGSTKDLSESKWEHHEKYIDIQYVIKGEEKMGIGSFAKTTVIEEYNTTKDIGFYSLPDIDCKYYIATPNDILIFFPQEAHRPSLKTDICDHNKKVVIKIKAN